MIRPGLVSVTFRQLQPEQIIDLAVAADIEGIEWAGDVHVKHGDINTAEKVRKATVDAGLKVVSYGSYYCVGESQKQEFKEVLDTAVALGAPNIRVWTGKKSSKDASEDYYEFVISDSKRIAEMACKYGIKVSYEFHCDTLTDTANSAKILLGNATNNLFCYWQPIDGEDGDSNRQSIRAIYRACPLITFLGIGRSLDHGFGLALSEGWHKGANCP